MRVPHTISTNTIKAYSPSEETLELEGEEGRRLKAEDFTWDEKTPASLAQICIKSLVDNFQVHYNVLSHLELFDLDVVYETLPTALPLESVLPLIQDGVYWKRRCLDTWSSMNDVTDYENSWKCMFSERYLQEIIESEEPGYTDWQDIGDTLKLCYPYIRRLVITQLQSPRTMESIPVAPDLCSTVDFIPEHLDLSPFIMGLKHLEELCLKFGVKDCGSKFTFKHFKVHTKDIERLAVGLQHAQHIRKLQITCSDIDDVKLNIILKSLLKCNHFHMLDLSHCKISDTGAIALGHYLVERQTISSLCLQNNFIGGHGAHGLAYAIEFLTLGILDSLNLKFNLIGDEGGILLASALATSKVPRELNLSGTGLEVAAGIHFARMLQMNSTLQVLDLSNNRLTNEAGEAIAEALERNITIHRLDIRNCEIDEDLQKKIYNQIQTNREMARKKKAEYYLRSERKKSRDILGTRLASFV